MLLTYTQAFDLNAFNDTGQNTGSIMRIAHARKTTGLSGDSANNIAIYFLSGVDSGGGVRDELAMSVIILDPNGQVTASAELDAANRPSGFHNIGRQGYDSEMDADGVIHIAIADNNSGTGSVSYVTFTTDTSGSGTWGASEVASSTVPSASGSNLCLSIAVDDGSIPHIAWAGLHSGANTYPHYINRIGGSWSADEILGTSESAHVSRPMALRHADGKLILAFSKTSDGLTHAFLRSGTGSSDTWDATSTDLSSLTGTTDASYPTPGIASTYWNLIASNKAFHFVGYDWNEASNNIIYAELPASAPLRVDIIEREVIHIDHFREFDVSSTVTIMPDSGSGAAIAVSDDGETVVVHAPFYAANSVQAVYQRVRRNRVEGFEAGPSYPLISNDTLGVRSMGSILVPDSTVERGVFWVNSSLTEVLALPFDINPPHMAGITHDVTIDGAGYMLAGPMTKVDITASIPRISIATEQKKYSDFSELDTFGQSSFHQGRGEKYLQDPLAFSDSDNVLTHIPNQATLALKSYQAAKTGGVDTDFQGDVVSFAVFAGNWYALVRDTSFTNNALYVWDNTNTEFDTVAAGLDTTSGVPGDMVVFGGDLWISQGEAVNMRYYDASAATWKDGQQPARALCRWDSKLWRADNINEVYYCAAPDDAVPTWTLVDTIGDADSFINRLIVYQDALFVLKEDGIYAVERTAANTYSTRAISDEDPYRDVDSGAASENGQSAFVDRGYLYYNRNDQVIRFDGASVVPMGPDRGADVNGGNFIGLPADEQGEFRAFTSNGTFLFGAVTPAHTAAAAYPQVLIHNQTGWHSFWKGTTLGNETLAVGYLPIRTTSGVLQYPTLWLGDGHTIRYIKLPRNSQNPLDDTSLEYVTSGNLDLAIYDAGLPDVEKVFGELVLQTPQISSYSGTVNVLAKLNELDASTMTGHNTTNTGGWWSIKSGTTPNANETRYVLGEPTLAAGAGVAFGGVEGGAPSARKIQLRLTLGGSGSTYGTPVIRGYAYRFISKPQERFGWTVPIKVYRDMDRLDGRKEQQTVDQLRTALYQARGSTLPVLFDEGSLGQANIVNFFPDPNFRVDGLDTAIGTVATNSFCTLHKKNGERSQFVYITNTSEAGVYKVIGSTSATGSASITATVNILNRGPAPVAVQLRDGSTVITEKVVNEDREWQEVTLTYNGTLTDGQWATLRLAVVRKASVWSAAFHISGAQVIFGRTEPVPHVDGDQPRCYWIGFPNASLSVRRRGYRAYVTGINETFRYRKGDTAEPSYDSEITLQLREVL